MAYSDFLEDWNQTQRSSRCVDEPIPGGGGTPTPVNLDRTLRVGANQTIKLLPTVVERQGKLLGFDSAGDPIAVAPSEGGGTDPELEERVEDLEEKYSQVKDGYIGSLKRPPGNTPLIASEGQTTFAVAGGYTGRQGWVTLNGVQVSAPVVNLASGVNIVFTEPLSQGDEVDYMFFAEFAVAGPSVPQNGSVTNDKVAANAGILSSKMNYLQDIPNTVAISMNERLGEVVLLEQFGATYQPGVGDQAAFYEALNYLHANKGGKLIVTKDVYVNKLDLSAYKEGPLIVIEGRGEILIKNASDSEEPFLVQAAVTTPAGFAKFNIHWKSFDFQAHGVENAHLSKVGVAFALIRGSMKFTNCTFTGGRSQSFYGYYIQYTVFENPTFRCAIGNAGSSGFLIESNHSAAESSNEVTMTGYTVLTSNMNGGIIRGGTNFRIFNLRVQDHFREGDAGLIVEPSIDGVIPESVYLGDPYCEFNRKRDIWIKACVNINIDGGSYQGANGDAEHGLGDKVGSLVLGNILGGNIGGNFRTSSPPEWTTSVNGCTLVYTGNRPLVKNVTGNMPAHMLFQPKEDMFQGGSRHVLDLGFTDIIQGNYATNGTVTCDGANQVRQVAIQMPSANNNITMEVVVSILRYPNNVADHFYRSKAWLTISNSGGVNRAAVMWADELKGAGSSPLNTITFDVAGTFLSIVMVTNALGEDCRYSLAVRPWLGNP